MACKKATWAGCGQHKNEVLRGVPKNQRCSCTAADKEAEDIARRVATLTAQQIRVLMMLKEGLLNKQIAYELSVSEATVKAHVSAILQKLDVDSRTQAVILASKIAATGWSPQDPASQQTSAA